MINLILEYAMKGISIALDNQKNCNKTSSDFEKEIYLKLQEAEEQEMNITKRFSSDEVLQILQERIKASFNV